MATSTDVILARIESIKASLAAAQDAELAILAGTVQSYSIDTGQDRQSAVKLNLTELRKYIDGLLLQLSTLEARLYGSGSLIVRPGW